MAPTSVSILHPHPRTSDREGKRAVTQSRSIAGLPSATSANLSDILVADQLNPAFPSGFTTRGLTISQLSTLVGPFVNVTNAPFNAKADGVKDDTVAIQAAIDDCATRGGGALLVPRGSLISNTLNITGKNHIRLIGTGWGISTFSPSASFLKWNGPAGIPMVKDSTFYGAHFENLRLIGNSASKPLCAIQFDSTTDDCTHNTGTRLWIGQMSGNDTRANTHFNKRS